MVHHAARRLKTRDTVGEPMIGLGRAILAGCKRSTDLARLYLSHMLGVRRREGGEEKQTSVEAGKSKKREREEQEARERGGEERQW